MIFMFKSFLITRATLFVIQVFVIRYSSIYVFFLSRYYFNYQSVSQCRMILTFLTTVLLSILNPSLTLSSIFKFPVEPHVWNRSTKTYLLRLLQICYNNGPFVRLPALSSENFTFREGKHIYWVKARLLYFVNDWTLRLGELIIIRPIVLLASTSITRFVLHSQLLMAEHSWQINRHWQRKHLFFHSCANL